MALPTIAVPEYTLILPSTGKELKYRPFLVKEEKILLIAMESEEEKDIINAIKNIINNCVFSELNVDDMPMFDLEYIFLQLRGKSKGEKIDLKYECPKCNKNIPVSINIDDIKVIKNKDNNRKIKFNDNLGVKMKYPSLQLQNDLSSMKEESGETETIFRSIVKSIDYIYDNENTYPAKDHTEKELSDFIESLTDNYFQKMSKFFETVPVLKHEFEIKCSGKKKDKSCGYKEKKTLEGLSNFFD
jgi:hypothetical protein